MRIAAGFVLCVVVEIVGSTLFGRGFLPGLMVGSFIGVWAVYFLRGWIFDG